MALALTDRIAVAAAGLPGTETGDPRYGTGLRDFNKTATLTELQSLIGGGGGGAGIEQGGDGTWTDETTADGSHLGGYTATGATSIVGAASSDDTVAFGIHNLRNTTGTSITGVRNNVTNASPLVVASFASAEYGSAYFYNGSGFLAGFAYGSGASIRIPRLGRGSSVFGGIGNRGRNDGTYTGTINIQGTGSTAHVYGYFAYGNVDISTTSQGVQLWGYAYSYDGNPSTIKQESAGAGSMVGGYAYYGEIKNTGGRGTFIGGMAKKFGHIRVSGGHGSIVFGYASGYSGQEYGMNSTGKGNASC